jgi:hypothetical protein
MDPADLRKRAFKTYELFREVIGAGYVEEFFISQVLLYQVVKPWNGMSKPDSCQGVD